ncbi:vWA domain-containing protein [Streptomonospora litoralis]|uniref:von Willebrand factor type A domain protein n=1 Tax=Streptomonospora litoralis TaxID=2498135 RepID=A0A4P6Q6M7_9ACTN|nr:VWA domain-containing protein [Streptomonospora litoralis]QBI56385.1 von Willebrand factor type A domain protein [Streptomonospora litoralis]
MNARAPGRAPDFAVRVDQNPWLAPGGTEVHAIVQVTAHPTADSGPVPPAAEVVVVDTSGSMHGEKLSAAKRAARAAVDALRNGVEFAVVAGRDTARVVYPATTGLAPASPRTRAEAHAAVDGLTAAGGTRMGAWLRTAGALFEPLGPGVLKHAILLTDGRNNERPDTFDPVLAEHAGRFVCDCRGVGTDWHVGELRRVAEALLGGVGIITDPERLAEDFRAMARAAMDKAVADVALRLWTPRGASVAALVQVAPSVHDLTARRTASGRLSGDYPTGSWGAETRAYHLHLRVPTGATGRRMRAGRVRPVPAGTDASHTVCGDVLAAWTADYDRAARTDPVVAHYTGRTELARAVQEGLHARRQGENDSATERLGHAVALAHASGNDATAALLDRVVEVVDAATGTVRLRPAVSRADEMTLDTHSTRTVPTRGGDREPGAV